MFFSYKKVASDLSMKKRRSGKEAVLIVYKEKKLTKIEKDMER
jgi:hypothetical protein